MIAVGWFFAKMFLGTLAYLSGISHALTELGALPRDLRARRFLPI